MNGWAMPTIWNAKSAKASHAPCVPASTPWFFAAAPWTTAPGTKYGGAPNADGYVVAKRGETTNIEVDVFSTQALPNDLTIAAGRFGYSSQSDPYKAGAVAPGVTLSLSQTTARNADKVTLSIQVASSVSSGLTAPFRIRALLSKTDYHSWPVILYVP
jgi:hypothetical protein